MATTELWGWGNVRLEKTVPSQPLTSPHLVPALAPGALTPALRELGKCPTPQQSPRPFSAQVHVSR